MKKIKTNEIHKLSQDAPAKLYRYMSATELGKLCRGEWIHPSGKYGNCGVCFLGEHTLVTDHDCGDVYDFAPLDCMEFIGGIVSEDYLVEFTVVNQNAVEDVVELYADPFGGFGSRTPVQEYHCHEGYDWTVMFPTRYLRDCKSAWWDTPEDPKWQAFSPASMFDLRNL